MGQLFADFFKERDLKVLISDRGTKLKNSDLAKKADITIVSVPIDRTEKVISQVVKHIPKDSALMDFTSIKEKPVKAMLEGHCEVLGMHPMFGDTNPVPGQTIILTPIKRSGTWTKWIEKFFRTHKLKIIKMSPKEHDKAMNVAQAFIHFADIAFTDTLRRIKMPVNEILKYTGTASELKLQLAARLIAQDPNLYGNIQFENQNILKTIDLYIKSMQQLQKIIKKKDLKAFTKLFLNARKYLGTYCQNSYKQSSYLIDKHLENQKKEKAAKIQVPTKNDIALLGPKNTFSDIAATTYLNNSKSTKTKYYCATIQEVFELVEKGRVKCGIIPIENKLHGTVRETLDNLFHKRVHIVDELNLPIHHCLITAEHAKKSDIKKIISHLQPINQCQKYLKKNYPKAEILTYSSTAAAAKKLAQTNDKSVAVIAPEKAAKAYELKVLDRNIEDAPNETTFILIRSGSYTPTKEQKNCTKTSIAFHFSADSPGTLHTVFKDFAEANINLTKIESRPTRAKFGQYIFYLDFEGTPQKAKIKKTLQKVKNKVAHLKVLGSF